MPAAPIAYTPLLVAAGSDGTLGFAVRSGAQPAVIRLYKPARLDVAVIKNFGNRMPVSLDLMSKGSVVGYGTVSGGKAKFIAPQGSFELRVGDSESVWITKKLLLAADRPTVVRLELAPTEWARNLGRPAPPLTPTDVRNWPPGKSFSSLRGKWVLVTFWATWCLPCVREMPELIHFYDKHPSERARFEILAIHSPDGGSSFAAIERDYDRLVKRWGKPIPFPLLFDSTGATHKRWGIEGYPTTLLVNPQGRLVGAATLKDLAAKLGT